MVSTKTGELINLPSLFSLSSSALMSVDTITQCCQALVKLLSRDGSHFKSFLLCVTSFKSRFNMLKTPWVCVYRKHNKLSLIFYWNSPLSFCDDDIWPLPEPEKAKQTLEMKYCKLNVSCSESVFRKFQNGMDCWCMDVM